MIFTLFLFFLKLQAQAIQSLYQERAVLHNQMEKDTMIYFLKTQQTSDQKYNWVYKIIGHSDKNISLKMILSEMMKHHSLARWV